MFRVHLTRAGLVLLVAVSALAAAANAGQAPANADVHRLGERMYREGILPSGEPMIAMVKGDIPVQGTAFTCANCHQRGGLGSFEGGIATLPTNAANLFKARYMLYMGTEVLSEPPLRDAYTEESLAKMLRTGIDPSGRTLDEIMPRYALGNEDAALLIDYLEKLSGVFSPGVSETTIRFATVITDEVSPEDRSAMLAPLEQFFRIIGNDGGRGMSQAGQAVFPSGPGYGSSKKPELAYWLLKGPRDTWRDQLENYYRAEPVFALVGGITKGDWLPIHRFSEEHRIPCLFPITDFPVISEADWYTLYFSKGLYQEGESAARFVSTRGRNIRNLSAVQIVRESQEGFALSAGFRAAWRELGGREPYTMTLTKKEAVSSEQLMQLMKKRRPDVLLVWDGPDALQTLQNISAGVKRPGMIVLSSSFTGTGLLNIDEGMRDAVYITYPYRLPKYKPNPAGVLTAEGGLDMQQRPMIIAKKMVSAVKVLSQALLDMDGNYYRDTFLDVIGMGKNSMGMGTRSQDETYPLFERFSFGPGQRYASKGCFIVQLGSGPEPALIGKSDWVSY